MDTVTGEPRFSNTHQGYADSSCWSRGQAWGIYGFLLSYRYTGDDSQVELSRRLAHYFLNRLPEDDVCHWDLALLGTRAGARQFGRGDCCLRTAGSGHYPARHR